MKFSAIIAVLVLFAGTASAQSQTTRNLEEKYNGFTLFFYKNTLRMINQKEDKSFDELVRNIEKMKFLMVGKTGENVKPVDYRSLVTEYKKESFEPIVTSRIEGRNLDVYLRDADGAKPGTVVLVNDSSNLYILDIVGTIDVSKAGALFNAIDSSSDIGKRIREFTEDRTDPKERRRRRGR